MKKEKNFKIDKGFMDLLNSRKLYLFLLIFIVLSLYKDDKVLNKPEFLFYLQSLISLLVILGLLLWRYTKYTTFYKSKLRDPFVLYPSCIVIIIFALVIQNILGIPFDFYASSYAKKNQIELRDCRITNVITTNIDKVHFSFNNKEYSRYFDISGHSRSELLSHYILQIEVRKSILDTYFLESMSLKRKF